MPNQVEGVEYNASGTAVICQHCRQEIPRGDDYCVRLYFPEDEARENPLGPYCSDCMPKLKVCCDCNKAFFGDDIKYYQNGIYYCSDCAAGKDICHHCGETHDITMVNGKKTCPACYEKMYYKCGKCNEIHEKTGVTIDELTRARYINLFNKWGNVCDPCFRSLKNRYKAKKVYACENCGKIHAVSGKYCEKCKSELPTCKVCGEKTHDYKQVYDNNGNRMYVCKSCRYSTCEGCGIISGKKMKAKKGLFSIRKLCDNCFDATVNSECTSCLNFAPVNAQGLCSKCEQIYSKTCSNCGSIDVDGGSRCRACDTGYSGIRNYSHRPEPLFHYTKEDLAIGDNIFMGFEDEVQCPSDTDRVLKDIYSHGLDHTKMTAKSDSSIRGNGFEMVSHPYTLRALKEENISALFKEVKAHESCGMHVHIDRRCLESDIHLYKIISFIHENEKFADVIAGRSYCTYSRKLEDKASKVVKDGNRERYQRVNLQNKATIEIRMFSSADREYKLMMRMEFCHALVSYTRNASIKGCKNFSGLLHYIKEHKKLYNNLYKFCASQKRYWNS